MEFGGNLFCNARLVQQNPFPARERLRTTGRSHLSNSGRGEAFGSAFINGDQHLHTNASPSPNYPAATGRSRLSNSGRGEAFGSASSNGDQHPHTNASPSPDYPVEAEDLGGLKNLRGLVLWTATLPNHADRSHQNPHDFMGIERDD